MSSILRTCACSTPQKHNRLAAEFPDGQTGNLSEQQGASHLQMGNPNVRIESKSGPSELERLLLRMTQSGHRRLLDYAHLRVGQTTDTKASLL